MKQIYVVNTEIELSCLHIYIGLETEFQQRLWFNSLKQS